MSAQGTTGAGDVVRGTGGYEFGHFVLDVGRGALLRDGEEIALRPKSFDVLHYLVRHPQRLVGREELLKAGWPGVVVTDDSLTQCLIEIRKALGDDDRSIVRTVPRRGYRFELPVQPTAGAPGKAAEAVPGRGSERSPTARMPSSWTLAALAVLAVALAATWWRAGPNGGPGPEFAADWQPSDTSIAVLPFADMSPDGDQEYLADGIAEEILNLLAQVRGLTVIARTSSFSFREQRVDVGTIARRLNVAHILEGSVRKSGDRVRVTAQLIDGATGVHLWSETYDRQLDDLFATQDEIAQSVTEVLRARLLGESGGTLAFGGGSAHTPDPEAWDLYLRGRHLYGRRMTGDRVQAQRYFERALEIDPEFAAAWVSLAAIQLVRSGDPDIPESERLGPEEAWAAAQNALATALELDPDQPEALLRLGRIKWSERDTEQAVYLAERAMQLGRNHARVQSILGGWAYALGDPSLGATLQGRAVALDPVNAIHLGNYGHMLFSAGRFEEAAAMLDAATTLNPEKSMYGLAAQVWMALLREDFAGAAELAGGLPPGPLLDRAQAMLAYARGDRDGSDAALVRIRLAADPDAIASLAMVHAFRGEPDAAFEALDAILARFRTWEDRAMGRHFIVELRLSPFLRPLHADPRWASWIQSTEQAMRRDGDERILAMLRAYAERDSDA